MSDVTDANTPKQSTDWHAPPARAVRLHATTTALWFAAIPLLAFAIPLIAADGQHRLRMLAWYLGVTVVAAMAGAMVGGRLRHQRWALDDAGLWLRQGRLWWRETRVPVSRVQHVDLKHGPLERRFGLATLVVHTAAAQLSGITVRGLDVQGETRRRGVR